MSNRRRSRQLRAQRQSRRYALAVAVLMAMTVALAVYLVVRQAALPGRAAAPAGPGAVAGSAGGPAAGPGTAPAQPDVEIRLKGESPSLFSRLYTVELVDRATGRSFTGGVDVILTADHKDMPGAHTAQIKLAPAGTPGTYTGEVAPVMVGDWKVQVVVSGAVTAVQEFTDAISAP